MAERLIQEYKWSNANNDNVTNETSSNNCTGEMLEDIITTSGVNGFWNFLKQGSSEERLEGWDSSFYTRSCSKALGLGGAMFFQTRKEAEEFSMKSTGLTATHEHKNWRFSGEIGTIYMAGKNHNVSISINKNGYAKTQAKKVTLSIIEKLNTKN